MSQNTAGQTEIEVRAVYEGGTNQLFLPEGFSRYCVGGYYPLCVGQRLKSNRYQIEHRLGYGSGSTVWLARDHEAKRWVSIKILVANEARASREVRIAKTIRQHTQNNPGSRNLCRLLDDFVTQSASGNHYCLVTELLGPSIARVLEQYAETKDEIPIDDISKQRHFDFKTVLNLSKSLLQGLAALHQAGFGHGDLSGTNVAFSAQRLSKMTRDDLLDLVGDPLREPLHRIDGKPVSPQVPKELTDSIKWEEWTDENREELRILDFGESFRKDELQSNPAQNGDLAPPEVFFTGCIDYRSDLWQAGILIHAFIYNHLPFSRRSDEGYLGRMVYFLGPLPSAWDQKRPHIRNIAEEFRSTASKFRPQHFNTGLENEIEEMAALDKRFRHLIPVIRELTRYKPSERISADQALGLLPNLKPSQG